MTDAVDQVALRRMRAGLLGIAGLIVAGTVVELVMRSHWTDTTQLVAWAGLVLLAVMIALVAGRPDHRRVVAVRIGVVVVLVAAAVGVVAHVHGNYEAAPLDGVYGPQWDAMSETSRWWAAFVQSVGPSPALAPGVLAVAALCVLVATVGLPAGGERPA